MKDALAAWRLTFFLFAVVPPNALAQWSGPRQIGFCEAYEYSIGFPLAVAIGPHREIAVASLLWDSLVCLYSSDSGRSFSRSVIDSTVCGGYMHCEYPQSVDGIGFDSRSNLYILWRLNVSDDAAGWAYFRISKSADQGRTFSLFWGGPSIAGSNLRKAALLIDSSDHLVWIWDGYAPEWIYLNRCSATDSSDGQATILQRLPISYWPVSAAVVAHANQVHIVLSGELPSYSGTSLYHLQSTDYGASFPTVVAVDTVTARDPELVLGNDVLLVHADGPPARGWGPEDTALVVRRMIEGLFGPSHLIKSNFRGTHQAVAARCSDSSVFVAFTEDLSKPAGVWVFEVRLTDFAIVDSLFLAGHHTPALAIDSSGGLYVVSEFNNALYLTTKDVVLSVPERQTQKAAGFRLSQNYPNPFNPSTTIRYELPHASRVSLKVYNTLGQEVATLVNETKSAGVYTVQFDAGGLASGVYFYRLQAGNFVEVKKLVVLR